MRMFQKAAIAVSVLLAGTIAAGTFLGTGQAPLSSEDKKDPVFEKPDVVKAIYLTSWSAASPNMVDYALELVRTTEINAVVLDIKDWSGYIFYDTGVPEAEAYGAEKMRIPDMRGLLERFHQEGVYMIARIVVFQDPVLAEARPDLAIHRVSDPASLWRDNSGLAWIDPATKESWDYTVAIAKDALAVGFDEVNFDYARFPSDGDLKDMAFPVMDATSKESEVMKTFFSYLREQLPQATLSVDLFGLSAVDGDVGVGQQIENAYAFFDFVSPMVYPSHYATGFLGYENPAEHPYEVVQYSMSRALDKLHRFKESSPTAAKLRPWLQDFNLGAVYDGGMVRAEITAAKDALGDEYSGFLLWSSNNIYTREALLAE